jgi:hypothetical protein
MGSSAYVSVQLTEEELLLATSEGTRRQNYNSSHNVRGRGGAPERGDHSLKINIDGAIGEYAAAKYLGLAKHLYTEYKPVPNSVDLPPNIDVKTPCAHNRRLVIFLNDDPQKIFLLATYEGEEIQLHGWSYGYRVMKDCFIEDPIGRGARYYVPKSALFPVDALRSYVLDLGYCK